MHTKLSPKVSPVAATLALSMVFVTLAHASPADADPSVVPLSFVDCLARVHPGAAQSDFLGTSMALVGDVTGDGIPDLAIGAPDARPSGAKSGAVYVVSGALSGGIGTAHVYLTGEDAADLAGTSVAAAGDVNGDGIDDLLIGAPLADRIAVGAHYGAAYLFYGPLSGTISLASADAIIENPVSGRLGTSLAGVGDVDGDGFDDILVSAPTRDIAGVDGAGAAYLFRGPLSGVLSTSDASATIYGEVERDNIGYTVAAVGDLNQDGFPDIGIGSILADHAGMHSGALYIFHGGPALTGSRSINSADHRIVGEGPDDWFSWAIAAPGDITGDGVDDLVVSSVFENTGGSDAGRVYVFAGPVTATSASQATTKLNGIAAYDEFGVALSATGDLTGDGIADLAVGASRLDGLAADAGGVLVFAGGPSLSGVLTTADARAVILGDKTNDVAGRSIAGGLDLDGDGALDLALGVIGRDGPPNNAGALAITDWAELTTDSDSDWLTDACETRKFATNAAQADSDDDGLLDGAEILTWGTDPDDPDTDGDLFGDGYEVQNGSDPNRWLSVPGPTGPVSVPLVQGSRNSFTDDQAPLFP